MEHQKTEWKDIRAIAVNGRTITLITGTREWSLDCSSASELAEILQFWARNDTGQVRLPEGSPLVLKPANDLVIGATGSAA